MDTQWEQRDAPGVARRIALPAALTALGLVVALFALPPSGAEPNFSVEVTDEAATPAPAVVERPRGRGRWTPVGGGPLSPREDAAFASGGGYVFIWGGREPLSPSVRADGATYSARENRWEPLPDPPISVRSGAATVWTGREFIVWGGIQGSAHLTADGAAFNPRTRRWRRLAPAPLAARQHAQVVSTGGRVIVWGGRRTGRTRFADGAAYDPDADRWERLPPGPLANRRDYDVSAVGLDGGMFVWSSSERSAATAFYDVRARRWRRLVTPRFEPGSAPVFTRLAGSVVAWGNSTIGDKGPLALTFTTRPDWWATLTRPPASPTPGATLAGGPEVAASVASGTFFDVLAERWEVMAPPPGPAAGAPASTAWVGRRLFVWHGASDENAGRALLWRPPNRWRTLTAAPGEAQRNITALWTGWLHDQQQILLFDRDLATAGTTYTPDLGLEETMPAAPGPPRVAPAVAWTGAELAVYGGMSRRGGGAALRRDGTVYEPVQNAWRPLPPAPFGVGAGALAAARDGLYAAGHGPADTIVIASYDRGTQRWRPLPRPPLRGPGDLLVVSMGFEVWVWRTGPDGTAHGAAWDPEHRSWRRLPALADFFGRSSMLAADRRMFLVADDGTTTSLGYGREGWRTHPRAPLRGAPPLLTWTGRRLVAYTPKQGALTSLDPRARTWAPHRAPNLGDARTASLLHTGRHLFAFGDGRIQVLGEEN